MSTRTSRKLSISDVLILIGAVAFALVGARTLVSLPLSGLPPNWWGLPVLLGSTWVVLVGTLALIPLRLTPPRPRRRQLWRQPGWLAAVAVALSLAICSLQQLLKVSLVFVHGGEMTTAEYVRIVYLETSYRLPFEAACSVTVVWLVLALSRHWAPEPGWIDRLGRACGWYWVAYPVLDWLVALP